MGQRSLSRFVAGAAGLALCVVAAGCTGDPEVRAIAVTGSKGGLTLIAGTLDRPCEEVYSIIIECGRWELEVYMPEGEATKGTKTLGQDGVAALSYRSDGTPYGDSCTARAEEFTQGTIELLEADADTVTYRVDGTTTPKFDADGTFVASRCK